MCSEANVWKATSMVWGRTTFAGPALLGCCLLLTASGCALHRTDRGLVLSSQWSLELNRTPWLAFRANKDVGYSLSEGKQGTAKSLDRPMTSEEWAASRPELLPWRSRLKEHRLASRLFHRKDGAKEMQHPGEAAAVVAAKSPQMPPASQTPTVPASTAVTTAEFEADALPASVTNDCELQIPDQAGSLPEINRPDLVVD